MATDPRAFISFDYDNNSTEKILFVGQIKNSRTPFDAQDWSSKTTLPQAQWERLLKEKIGKCHLMIVLVGKSMGSATGVAKEIGFATDQDVPFFGVYVDGAGTNSGEDALRCRDLIGTHPTTVLSFVETTMLYMLMHSPP